MLYVLADSHAGTDASVDRALLELLDSMGEAELLILGDLFRAFVGLPRYWTSAQRDVLEALERLRARGGRIRFVVGNRDYLIRPIPDLPFDQVIEDRAVIDLAGLPTLVTHGDGLDPRDVRYRAWRRLSRSAGATWALRALPGFVGRHLASGTERTLANTNRAYKAGPLPLEALLGLGREAAELGAKRALVGHFHRDEIIEVPNGAPVQLAPAWLDHRRVLVAREDGRLESITLDEIPR
jgi:UDP-2,3-diacylglucosamine hydrolase